MFPTKTRKQVKNTGEPVSEKSKDKLTFHVLSWKSFVFS